MRIIYWAFLLMALLIIVMYSRGTTQSVGGITTGLRSLVYALTGRNVNGQAVAYPTGNF